MRPPPRNVAASVRDRLLKLARASGQPSGELLDRYCVERLLYRLSRSEHRGRFIHLKVKSWARRSAPHLDGEARHGSQLSPSD